MKLGSYTEDTLVQQTTADYKEILRQITATTSTKTLAATNQRSAS